MSAKIVITADAIPPDECLRGCLDAVLFLERFGLVPRLSGRYASYAELADIIRARFADPQASLRELYKRMVFNVLVGNTDDHARNHAAFWDGRQLRLPPAYDICPQARSNPEANQAIYIADQNRRSQLEVCRLAARKFLLRDEDAPFYRDATSRCAWDHA